MKNFIAFVDTIDYTGQLLAGHGGNEGDVVIYQIANYLLVDCHEGFLC